MSLDINEICFEEEQDTPNKREKSRKSQNVAEWCRCERWGAMCRKVKYLRCGEVEALGYFQLSDMR